MEPSVEREFQRFRDDMLAAEQRLRERIAEVEQRLAQDIRDLKLELDAHVIDTRTRFEERAKERVQEQKEALLERQAGQRWRIGTVIVVIGLVISAVAVLLNAIQSAPG